MRKFGMWLALVGCGLVVVGAWVPQAGGQRREVRLTPRLALARLAVSEGPWVRRVETEDGTTTWSQDADMRGIHGVILRGMERHQTTYLGFARQYARRLIGRQGEINRPWLWGLNPTAGEPDRWPAEVTVCRGGTCSIVPHAPWTAYRQRWLDTYERAGEVAELTLATWDAWGPCPRPADDWGGAVIDAARAARLGLVRIEGCEPAQSAFYLRPSTIRAEQEQLVD